MDDDTFEFIGIVVFCLAVGVLTVYKALQLKRGVIKRDFLGERRPRLPKDSAYGYWPFGLGWLITAVGMIISLVEKAEPGTGIGRLVAIGGLFGGFILFLLFMAIKPNFIKPQWLLWLESNYDRTTINFLFAQARLDPEHWESLVSTQRNLEIWAEETILRERLSHFSSESPVYAEIMEKISKLSEG